MNVLHSKLLTVLQKLVTCFCQLGGYILNYSWKWENIALGPYFLYHYDKANVYETT